MRYSTRDEKGRFCKKETTVTKGYKGFNKGLICLKKQYKVGETHEENGTSMCEKGMMHFCENPLSVLNYYPVVDPKTGVPNEFAEVEAVGKVTKADNKSATNKLRIVRKISLLDLIKAAATARDKSHAMTTEMFSSAATVEEYSHALTAECGSNAATLRNQSNAATTGLGACAVTAGDNSNAATTGDHAEVATTGNRSHAMASGFHSNAVTTGNGSDAITAGNASKAVTIGAWSNAAATGGRAYATTKGYYSNAITAGPSSEAVAEGSYSIAAALGFESRAKAALGSWIVLAEYDSNYMPSLVKAAKVDGDIIKPNTFYKLKNGEFVKA